MVWLKLSDDHGDECARAGLSDAAFRTHVEGLLWTMRRETGGRIDRRDVRRFAESENPDDAVRELVAAGFWRTEGDGWQIVQAMEWQLEPDVAAARRAMNAERQRRKRRKDAKLDVSQPVVTRDVTRDDPRDPGRDGTGRDGTGNSRTYEEIPRAREGTGTQAREGCQEWQGSAAGVCGAPKVKGSPYCFAHDVERAS